MLFLILDILILKSYVHLPLKHRLSKRPIRRDALRCHLLLQGQPTKPLSNDDIKVISDIFKKEGIEEFYVERSFSGLTAKFDGKDVKDADGKPRLIFAQELDVSEEKMAG